MKEKLRPGFYFAFLGDMPYYAAKPWLEQWNVVNVTAEGETYACGSEVPDKAPELVPDGWVRIEPPANPAKEDA